jgi:two-component system chemotaxis sensor kinase CheA
MDLARYAALFASEARDHLAACTRLLLAWERDPALAPVDELFRAVHTIKGMAASMGYDAPAATAHALEHRLAGVREGGIVADAAFVDELIDRVRVLEGEVRAAVGEWPTAEFPVSGAAAGAVAAPAAARPPQPGRRGTPRKRRGTASADAGRDAAAAADGGPSVDGTADARAIGADGGTARPLAAAAPVAAPADATVRVPRARLDRMGRLAAELEVARHRLALEVPRFDDPVLEDRTAELSRAARALADEVFAARLTPVGELFDRFPLLVRDTARALGREVRLETVGRAIEVDRDVLEALAEPLVHLVRNAIGHGIEMPEARAQAGKPREGRVTLGAVRERGGVIITVEDDGAGVDRTRVRALAVAQGLLAADAPALDDDRLAAILARPGFSTAAEATDVSGRGVGVDAMSAVVRRLRGTFALRTTAGRGTVWSLRVPVSAASVRALLAQVGPTRVALPFPAVREAARVPREAADGTTVDVRGRAVPMRALAALLGVQAAVGAGRQQPAVVVNAPGGELALAVDALLGQQEILVEPFAAPVGLPAWVDGATVLADGGAALVLAPGALS